MVYLRTNCTGIADCFDNTTPLNSYINVTRRPSASTPLLVDIGAGTFGAIDCDAVGGLSLRGAGRSATILVGGPSAVNGGGAFNGRDCAGVGVQDMTLSGFFWWVKYGSAVSASANVSNVLITNNNYTVFEYCSSGGGVPANTINWWSSRLESSGQFATVFAGCAEHRFFGSDILRNVGANSDLSRGAIAVESFGGTPSVSLYGTSVRAKMAPGAIVSGTIYGVTNRSGTFHSHGGEIVADARGGAQNVGATAVYAQNAVATHIVETSFGVHPATGGVAKRVESWKNDPVSGALMGDPATLEAPFLWTAGGEPPPIATGAGAGAQDLFVERGCTSTGNCAEGSGGTQPHLMILSAGCSPSPWFDVVTGRCRNQ